MVYIRRILFMMTSVFISAFFVGQVLAQTTTTSSGMMWCPNGTQVPQGSTCPASSTTTQPTMTTCPDGSQVASGATCPTADPKTTCINGGNKWCVYSSGSGGYCGYGADYKCPAYDESSCTAQAGKWCKNSSSGGWCSSDTSYVCPPYDEASCKAVSGGVWCINPNSPSYPWCAYGGSTCPYTSTQTTTTNNTNNNTNTTTATQCASGSKSCKNSDGTSYCSYSSGPCPAYTAAECTAQNGEWCAYQSAPSTGSTGWCSSTKGNCPIYDKTACEAVSRKWCANSYTSGTTTAISSGWCAMLNDSYGCGTSNATPTPTPSSPLTPMPYMTWPNTKTECESYSGKWCESTAGGTYAYAVGSCMMGNKTCPLPYKSGYMTCWDNTQVPSGSYCPISPSNQTECTKLGKNWCVYNTQYSSTTSGWCSADECMPSAPSGKMICPDGKTFGTTTTDCPKSGATTPVPVPVQPVKVKCQDGSFVENTTANCPAQKPETNDEVSRCLATNGSWCTASSGTTKGYCVSRGNACDTTKPTEPPDDRRRPELPPEPDIIVDSATIKQIEREKKSMLRELSSMERLFKKSGDAPSLAKIVAVRDKIQNLQVTGANIFDTLEMIREEMDNLRVAYQDLQQNGNVNEPGRDAAFQKRALAQIKQGIKSFKRYLTVLDAKIRAIEKSGIIVQQSTKDLVSSAKDLVAKAEAAKTYDEARDIIEQLPDIAETLNDELPKLEQLTRIPRVLKIIQAQVTAMTRLVKTTEVSAKRYRVDVSEQISQMRALVDEAATATENLKTGAFEGEDVFVYIQENIIDKLSDVRVIADNIAAITNIKKYSGAAYAETRRFDAAIKKLNRSGDSALEAIELLVEMKSHLTDLTKLAGQKINEETGALAIEHMENISMLKIQLDEMLGLAKPGALEDQIRRSLMEGQTEVRPVEIDNLEKLIVQGYRTANFFRTSPYRTLALLN